jgi:4-carboxymuconolactone decarboxylase
MMPEEPRLPELAPSAFTDEQRAVYNAITGGPRGSGPQLFQLVDGEGALTGPFNAFLLQPQVGGLLQALGSALRYQTSLSDRAREIAILVVAVHWESAFEWYAHEAVGRHVGLSDAELDCLRRHDYDELANPDERLVARTTHRLVAAGDLDLVAYREAVDSFGPAVLFELLTLVGYYATLALQLRVFRVATPEA